MSDKNHDISTQDLVDLLQGMAPQQAPTSQQAPAAHRPPVARPAGATASAPADPVASGGQTAAGAHRAAVPSGPAFGPAQAVDAADAQAARRAAPPRQSGAPSGEKRSAAPQKPAIPPEEQRPFVAQGGLQLDDSPLVNEDFRRFFTTSVTPNALFSYADGNDAHRADPLTLQEEDEEAPPPPPPRRRRGLWNALRNFFTSEEDDDEGWDEQEEPFEESEALEEAEETPARTHTARRMAGHGAGQTTVKPDRDATSRTVREVETDGAQFSPVRPDDGARSGHTRPDGGAQFRPVRPDGGTVIFEKQQVAAGTAAKAADGATTIFEKQGSGGFVPVKAAPGQPARDRQAPDAARSFPDAEARQAVDAAGRQPRQGTASRRPAETDGFVPMPPRAAAARSQGLDDLFAGREVDGASAVAPQPDVSSRPGVAEAPHAEAHAVQARPQGPQPSTETARPDGSTVIFEKQQSAVAVSGSVDGATTIFEKQGATPAETATAPAAGAGVTGTDPAAHRQTAGGQTQARRPATGPVAGTLPPEETSVEAVLAAAERALGGHDASAAPDGASAASQGAASARRPALAGVAADGPAAEQTAHAAGLHFAADASFDGNGTDTAIRFAGDAAGPATAGAAAVSAGVAPSGAASSDATGAASAGVAPVGASASSAAAAAAAIYPDAARAEGPARDGAARDTAQDGRPSLFDPTLAGQTQAPDADADDYTDPAQQEEIGATLHGMVSSLTVRAIILAVLGFNALYFGLAAAFPKLPQPTGLLPSAVSGLFVLMVYLVSLLVAGGVSLPTLKNGAKGLLGQPSADSFALLSWVGAMTQCLVLLVSGGSFDATAQPVLATFTLLALLANTLGKRSLACSVEDNFSRLTQGQLNYAVAFLLQDSGLVRRLTHGLGEPEPYLLVSRPTAFYTGFLDQSFGQRQGDTAARLLCRVLPAVAVVAGVLGVVINGQFLLPFAAVLCISCPLTMVLVSSVPTRLMNKSVKAIGTILPGPRALEDLGQANVVVADAQDLFPAGSITLKGVKMFTDKRIDLAILYAASLLVPACPTLRSVFLNIIADRTELLYKVEHLNREVGCGFEGWADNHHLLVGNRGMMISHGVEVPPEAYEAKHTKEGKYCPVYVAVNGRLYAMFVVGYRANADVKAMLDEVYVSGLSLLVTSDDFNLTSERINTTYGIPSGCIKVLGAAESEQLAAYTAPCSRCGGVMVHATSFRGFIEGIRIAANASSMEKVGVTIQTVAVLLSALLVLVFTCTGGLGTLNLLAILLYQLAWTLLTLMLPVTKQY